MDDRQVIFRYLPITALDNRKMLVASSGKRRIGRPSIRHHERSRRLNTSVDEHAQGGFRPVRHDFHTEPSSDSATTTLLGFAFRIGLAFPNLNGGYNKGLIVVATANAAGCAANPRLVHLDMIALIAADASGFRPDHTGAQLVQDLKCRLVACEAKLPLELNCGHAGRARRQLS
jgi:hypothetical protein